jgi:hypothetical protein
LSKQADEEATTDAPICCTPKFLAPDLQVQAAEAAWAVNPTNKPSFESVPGLSVQYIALLTSKWWGSQGANLSVSFLTPAPADLRAKIVWYANKWSTRSNVNFTEVPSGGHIRITLTPGLGHWSYLGTDILHIPANQATMNLDSFSLDTPDSEYSRVVPHEFGHAIGCPHEHLRSDIVGRIDAQKATAYYAVYYGWSAEMVQSNVLTPINESSLLPIKTPRSDVVSIMAYQLPAEIMIDGVAVPGGTKIDESDHEVMSRVYPLPETLTRPPNPPEPPPVKPPVKPPVTEVPGWLALILKWLQRQGQTMNPENVRALADALHGAATEAELHPPDAAALAPGAMNPMLISVLQILWKMLPQIFPFLTQP